MSLDVSPWGYPPSVRPSDLPVIRGGFRVTVRCVLCRTTSAHRTETGFKEGDLLCPSCERTDGVVALRVQGVQPWEEITTRYDELVGSDPRPGGRPRSRKALEISHEMMDEASGLGEVLDELRDL